MSFTLESSAFRSGEAIPTRHTRDGLDLSPPLIWTPPPPGTGSLLLLVEDPDAPGGLFTHWLVTHLPPSRGRLDEGLPKALNLPDGTKQGRNDYGRFGYGGPAPPPGRAHRYFFRMLALRDKLAVSPGTGRAEVDRALEKMGVLGWTELVGIYGRS